jgi:hypothetical protein
MKIISAAILGLALAAARPASACCQLGGTACGDPFAVSCNNGVVCFIPYRTCSGCTCTITNGGQTCLATASQPGRVATLHVDRSLATQGALDFTWSASCSGTGPDYSVQEGVLGSWYSHEPLRCTSGGALSLTLTPSGGNRYYLIAPILDDFTGSLGTSSAGAERPDGSPSCTSDRALAPCP